MSSLTIENISLADFKKILSRYPSSVPEKLQELDTLRYTTIPTALAKRKADRDAYLQKSEVEKMVEWKLKHGTFRPKLLQLVQSNDVQTIEETTREAYKLLPEGVLPSVKVLVKLKGIGPATASLLLAVFAPESVPFFSDELFRWVMWDEPGKPAGWQRVIKYNVKEYDVVVQRVGRLRKRLDVAAVDVEKVGWVLGREGVDVGSEKRDEDADPQKEDERAVTEKEKGVMESKQKAEAKKGVKRKIGDAKSTVEGVRRSSRRKTAEEA